MLAWMGALLPVCAGAGVAAWPRLPAAALRALRWAASLAALAVVGLVLVPDALEALGPAALVVCVGFFALPYAVERAADRWAGHTDRYVLGLDLGLAGVAVHQAVEGAQLGALAYSEALLPTAGALALHTVPLVAVVLVGHRDHAGHPIAVRTGVLLVATGAGVAAGQLAVAGIEALEPWIAAAVAGLLGHIVLHDVGHEHADPP